MILSLTWGGCRVDPRSIWGRSRVGALSIRATHKAPPPAPEAGSEMPAYSDIRSAAEHAMEAVGLAEAAAAKAVVRAAAAEAVHWWVGGVGSRTAPPTCHARLPFAGRLAACASQCPSRRPHAADRPRRRRLCLRLRVRCLRLLPRFLPSRPLPPLPHPSPCSPPPQPPLASAFAPHLHLRRRLGRRLRRPPSRLPPPPPPPPTPTPPPPPS